MKSPRNPVPFLVVANLAALGFLAAVHLAKPADAQGGRARATYVAASGRIPGTETHAVYVVDESNQEVIAVAWNPRSKQLELLGYRSLPLDAGELLRPRSN